MEQFTNKKM